MILAHASLALGSARKPKLEMMSSSHQLAEFQGNVPQLITKFFQLVNQLNQRHAKICTSMKRQLQQSVSQAVSVNQVMF